MTFTACLCDCQQALLDETADPKTKRNELALTYAMAIRSENGNDEKIDWKIVNKAIIERWSKSGLKYIKEKAWKHIEEKTQSQTPGGE